MKMTYEQMKALVTVVKKSPRAIRIDLSDYRNLFSSYNTELLAQICYNLNKGLDWNYIISDNMGIYNARTEMLALLSRWLQSDEQYRTTITQQVIDHIRHKASCVDTGSDENNAAQYALIAAILAIEVINPNSTYVRGNTRPADECLMYSDLCNSYATEFRNINLIIIKTILDYYGEDFKTFEALYL